MGGSPIMHKEDFIYGEEKNCYVGINRSSIIDNVFRTCIGSRKCSSYRYSSISANYRPLMGKYKNRCAVNFDGKQISVSVYISPISSTTTTTGKLYLEKKSGNGWAPVTSWPIDVTGKVDIAKTYSGTTGVTYRTRVVVTTGADEIDVASNERTV
jgi:hypothetical protein